MPADEQGQRPIQIFVIEDNPADLLLIETALRDARIVNEINSVTDGEQALEYLNREGNYQNATRPDIVFLDLSLPKLDGHQVLAAMKATPALRSIPVIVVSGSNAQADLLRAYDQQVAGYLVKPTRHDDYFNAIRSVKELWFHIVTLPPRGESAKTSS